MNTQILSTLQVFQSLSYECKRVYPVSVHNKFAQRKPAEHEKISRGKISKRGSIIVSKMNILGAKKRRSGVRKRDTAHKNYYSSRIKHLSFHKQFIVPTSVYNKNLITQSVTKQELPKYKPSHISTYHVDSLKKEINKKIFSKADSLVDKILSCPRIKLSNSQTLILDGVETGLLLADFAQLHLNDRSCKGSTHRMVLLMGLCAT